MNGGGIYNSSRATLRIDHSTIDNNSSDKTGGGIYNYGGTMTLNTCTVTGNRAERGDAGTARARRA
jgi:hypothetical protein